MANTWTYINHIRSTSTSRAQSGEIDSIQVVLTIRLSYIAYLDMLRRETVERNLELRDKSTREYLEYVQTLYNYLVSFFERALPLMDLDAKLKEEGDNFAAAWEAGQVEGWTEGPAWKKAAVKPAGEGIWCPYCAHPA